MEKIIRLYKIPEIEEIVTVQAFIEDFYFPENSVEGDLVVNHDDTYGYRLFEYKIVYDELDWIDIQQDPSKYYCAKGDGEPQFFNTVNGVFQPYEAYFPQNKRVAEITSFTYSATRMGNAPTISGTLMYRECLDELWDDRVCVYFNKKFYFIDKIPTSEYSNTDERYKHSCEFVSENKLLENVYFTNVVDIDQSQEDITRLPMQWLQFSFNGGINEFIRRLNLSLAYSGLDAQHVGFRVVRDALEDTEDKLISISDTTLKAALDLIYETWGIPYWFDGYTIHIGYSNEQQMAQAGVTMPTFQYGATQSLLSLQKSQSNDIVNRITGLGSEENIPTFYPNKNPNALELQYLRGNEIMTDYARIANPYKTVRLEPSGAVEQGVPSGSYFKYMPIQKTYNYDQSVSVNTHSEPRVIYEDGQPSLYLKPLEDYNIQSRYFVQPYGGTVAVIGHSNAHPKYNIVCKRIWVWLHEGTFESLSIKDEMNPVDMFDTGGASSIIFDGTDTPRFFVKAQSYTYTREQYETVNRIGAQGFSPYAMSNLIDKYFNLRTDISGNVCVWNDGTETETYNEIFPIDIQNLPTNTTCLSFTVGIMSRYNDATADTSYVQTQLKTVTKTVMTHVLLSSPDWSLNADGHVAQLWRYGIRLNSGVEPQENDIIYFTREAGALPYFGQLLPYSFRETHDIWLNAINSHYLKDGSQTDYYTFENLYKISCAKEHIENFDDIKPSIKGMTNNETPAKRIDKILGVAFDQNDNNDLLENGTDYQHPYFFVKLAKTSLDDGFGFNLFDCAIDGETMKLNMADGNNGGCVFEIMVKYLSDGMAYNPVGLFTEATTINGVTYPAGTPRRNLQTGDVLVNRKEDIQQDTSASEVWIALKKDNQTFGHYSNGAEVVYPDSKRGNKFIPHTGDSFTITNICLPYAYIVAAEKRLYHALLDYMEKNNPHSWTFSIKFSSIYYKKHYEFMDKWFNEASRVPFIYNGITRNYYVQSYSYKMSYSSALPEVTVELNEKVKKRNVFYPVPYNPYADVSYQSTPSVKRLRKEISDYMAALPAQDSEINNLQVHGDVTLSNGISLNAQITAINSQIYSNERLRTKENTWNQVADRTEIENLFVDGKFEIEGYNSITATNASVSDNSYGIVGEKSKLISLQDSTSSVTFEQKIPVTGGDNYTVSFWTGPKMSEEAAVNLSLKFYDDKDELLEEVSEEITILTDDAYQQTKRFSAPQAAYAKVAISNPNDSVVSFDLDGVMVFNGDYTTLDQSGDRVASSMLPKKYVGSEKELKTLIQSSGSAYSDVLVCTFTLTSSTRGTINKTAAEILQAASDGKLVICVYGNEIYYLVSKNVLTFSRILQRSSKYITYDQTNDNWAIVTINLQQQLVSGSNIKTINGNSVLGSGNLDITTPLYDNGTRIIIDTEGTHTIDLTDHAVTIINFADEISSVSFIFQLNSIGDRIAVFKRTTSGFTTVTVAYSESNLSNKSLRSGRTEFQLAGTFPSTITVKCRKIDSDVYFIENSTVNKWSGEAASGGATWTPPSE